MPLSEGYLNNHMTPKKGNPIDHILSSGKYLHTATEGNPTDLMTPAEYVNDYMTPEEGIYVDNIPHWEENVNDHTARKGGIPTGHSAPRMN